MKFYVVIPARYDSSRFPGKVLSLINGSSMLELVYNSAVKSDAEKVFIATDSDVVFKEAKKFTKNIFLTSNSNINGTERIAELAKKLKWSDDLLIINLQADMPQIKFDNINYLARKSKNNDGLSTLYYPLKNKKCINDQNTVKIEVLSNKICFSRITEVSKNIYKHIGIYAYTVKNLHLYKSYSVSSNEKKLSLEQYRFIDNGHNVHAYLAISDPGISVDSIDNINEIIGVNN